jgi:uncharacterized protein
MIITQKNKSVQQFVESRLRSEGTGHDWFHVERVTRTALMLAKQEGVAELGIVEAAALLHDIPDRKIHPNPQQGLEEVRMVLEQAGYSGEDRETIVAIIEGVSYKGAHVETPMATLEGRVVQDADRLDALGAIGVARCFAYGGKKGRLLYDPAVPPILHQNAEQYHNDNGPSLNHFYEKLLLLKDRMQTESGKKAAAKRHRFLNEFVSAFLSEWQGQDLPS